VIVNPLMREHPWSAGDAVCRGGSWGNPKRSAVATRRHRRPRAGRSALASGFRLSLTLAFNIGDEESK
jgi:formylglycine-generating enzyme required for sulfatase activity